jgi:hypothetical protein
MRMRNQKLPHIRPSVSLIIWKVCHVKQLDVPYADKFCLDEICSPIHRKCDFVRAIYYLHISARQNLSANGTSSCFTWHTFHIINQIAKRQGGEILSHIGLCPHNKIKCHILLIPPPNWGTFQYMVYCVLSLKNNIN